MLSFFLVCRYFLPLFVVWRRVVSQLSTSRTSYTRYYTAVRRIIYLACLYTYRVLLTLLLLLCTGVVAAAAAAVRHRVADSKNCCWFIEYDSIQCFISSFKHDIFIMYVPLGSTVAFSASICLYYILGSYGMRGAKTGVIPPRRSPPCTRYHITAPFYLYTNVSYVICGRSSLLLRVSPSINH